MAQRILRPLGYGGMLDEMFDLYKKHFVAFIGIACVLYLPLDLLLYPMLGVMQTGPGRPGGSHAGPPPNLTGLIAAILLMIPAYYIILAAVTSAVSISYTGGKPTIVGTLRSILPKLIPLMLTMLLMIAVELTVFLPAAAILFRGSDPMIGILAMLLGLVPFVVFSLLFTFAPQALVIEGKQYVAALNRSWQLASSCYGSILLVNLIIGLLSYVVQVIFNSPFQILIFTGHHLSGSMFALQGLAAGLAQAITMPISAIALSLIYYDARIRTEGFDIEMLARDMNERPVPVELQQ